MINGIRPNHVPDDFDKAVNKLIEGIHTDYFNWRNGRDMEKANITTKKGRKFLKIIRDNSVWGFVALKDGSHKGMKMLSGDVLKAAGWSAPAKHTRGNIFDKNQDYFRWTGPDYLI